MEPETAAKAQYFRRGFSGVEGRCADPDVQILTCRRKMQLDTTGGTCPKAAEEHYCDIGINHLGDEMLSQALGAVTLTGKRMQNHQER